jgi:polyprenyl-phospho-N-acetylgalactosaminyl synthase
MKVFIVIGAFNEEKRIRSVLSGIRKNRYKNIVVVDDGSSDRTYEIAKGMAQTLRHIINRGQGAALQTGIDYALQKGADIIVTYDADGQFLVKEIKRVIRPIQDEEADIVLGSRFLGKAVNIPFLKKAVLKIGVLVVFALYRIRITDSQCGFRAISRKAAEKIEITSDRMEHAADFFSEIMRHKLKYKEVPVTVIYDDYALGKGQSWTRSFELGVNMLLKKLLR